MLQEKQFYLKCLAEKSVSQRVIANRMSRKFSTSPAAVKDALLQEGLIVFSHVRKEGTLQKNNHYYKLTGKKLSNDLKPMSVTNPDYWEDGTPKSRGNAFDMSTAKGLFNKSELAATQNKGKPHNYNATVQVIAYSRA